MTRAKPLLPHVTFQFILTNQSIVRLKLIITAEKWKAIKDIVRLKFNSKNSGSKGITFLETIYKTASRPQLVTFCRVLFKIVVFNCNF